MNIKLRLKIKDIIKLLLGGRILVKNPYDKSVVHIQKGIDTYITK
jgi:hypothetical protein